jgi:hypothetical protein
MSSIFAEALPGFRNVRAPLLAGYIWLVAAWLVLAGDLPEEGESSVYRHGFEMGEAIGRVGLILAATVLAYLIGSLVQVVVSTIADRVSVGWSAIRTEGPRLNRLAKDPGYVTARSMFKPPVYEPGAVPWIEGDGKAKIRLGWLFDSEIGAARKELREEMNKANKRIRNILHLPKDSAVELAFHLVRGSGQPLSVSAFVVRGLGKDLPLRSEDAFANAKALELPTFSARRNIFEERGALKTLLMETTAQAGAEVDRLYGEAELRFAIALPLAALIIVLLITTENLWWSVLLLAPAGLLFHASLLNRRAGLELVEALRSRDPKEELPKVAPNFRRYRRRAKALTFELRQIDWIKATQELQSRQLDEAAERTA